MRLGKHILLAVAEIIAFDRNGHGSARLGDRNMGIFFVVCKNPTVLLKVKGFPALVALCVCRSIASFLSAVRGWWQPQPGALRLPPWSHQGWFAFVEQLFNCCLVLWFWFVFVFLNKYSTR